MSIDKKWLIFGILWLLDIPCIIAAFCLKQPLPIFWQVVTSVVSVVCGASALFIVFLVPER